MQLLVADPLPSPLRRPDAQVPPPLRVGLVQHRWRPDRDALVAELADGIATAAGEGAKAVFLPELTLSRYPADTPAPGVAKESAEPLLAGPTFAFAAEQAERHGIFVHASLFERPAEDDRPEDPRGYNTAILVAPDGSLAGRTRKTHIPITAGYYEDTWFRPGDAGDAYPVHEPAGLGVRLGLPTCWDEWFPEVARLYGLAGAEVLAYPTAIGSEPDWPDFDTQPLWRQVIVANGITSGLFMVVPNRYGAEGAITFYGSSFLSDPFGRVLVAAPRDASAVLVADLDLAQRREWLALFPFLLTRRPDSYGALSDAVDAARHGFGTVPTFTAGR
ncbi:MAG: nitrilase-related carbon-nitrogen hydrolase [Amnibacterium sp.]